jgi:hypothetical protein
MPNMFEVEVIDTGVREFIKDPDPIESAQLYWQISDEIWNQKPAPNESDIYDVPAVMKPDEALEIFNATLLDIDEMMVITGQHTRLALRGFGQKRIEVDRQLFAKPEGASVGTKHWDDAARSRSAFIDNKRVGVKLLDGTRDKDRELYASFHYHDERRNRIFLRYAMQRYQPDQDKNIPLSMSVWHDALNGVNYEGSLLDTLLLSKTQEIKILRAIQIIGGLVIEAAS